MILILLFLGSQPVNKFSIDIARYNEITVKTQIREEGIYLNDIDGLKLLDFEGNLQLHIPPSEEGFTQIRTFHVSQDFIWITGEISLASFFYNLKGEFLFKDEELFAMMIQDYGDGTYFLTPGYHLDEDRAWTPFVRYFNLNREPFPRMGQVFRIGVGEKEVFEKKQLQSFYKASKAISEKQLQFKKIWAFRDGVSYAVINQVENISTIYNPSHLAHERNVPLGQPYQARIAALNLPSFKEVAGAFVGERFYRDAKNHKRDVLCWIMSQSAIENVFQLQNGYAVGYLTPTEPCVFGRLMVAKLNRNFRFQTMLIELDRNGVLAGIFNDQAYVLVPNFRQEEAVVVEFNPEIWVFDLPK